MLDVFSGTYCAVELCEFACGSHSYCKISKTSLVYYIKLLFVLQTVF